MANLEKPVISLLLLLLLLFYKNTCMQIYMFLNYYKCIMKFGNKVIHSYSPIYLHVPKYQSSSFLPLNCRAIYMIVPYHDSSPNLILPSIYT